MGILKKPDGIITFGTNNNDNYTIAQSSTIIKKSEKYGCYVSTSDGKVKK